MGFVGAYVVAALAMAATVIASFVGRRG